MTKTTSFHSIKPHKSFASVWWTCSVGAIAFCLWLSNLLPIQRVDFELTTNIAISQHRLASLQNLVAKDIGMSDEDPSSFRIVSIQPVDTDQAHASRSELVATQLKIQSEGRVAIAHVERRLDVLTIPNVESTECAKIAAELRKAVWIGETYQHSLHRLALDTDRDQNAVELTDATDSNDHANEHRATQSPFQVASFSFRSSRDPNAQVRDRLLHQVQANRDQIDMLSANLARHRELSRGFLSFTGSPQTTPIAHALTRGRYAILCIMSLAIWLFLVYWMLSLCNPRPLATSTRRGTQHTPSSSIDDRHSQVAHWLSTCGIAYLGSATVEWAADNHTVPQDDSISSIQTEVREPFQVTRTTAIKQSKTDPNVVRLQWVSDRLIVLWVVAFVLRLSFDTHWRELVCVAPLAAISRLLLGVQ